MFWEILKSMKRNLLRLESKPLIYKINSMMTMPLSRNVNLTMLNCRSNSNKSKTKLPTSNLNSILSTTTSVNKLPFLTKSLLNTETVFSLKITNSRIVLKITLITKPLITMILILTEKFLISISSMEDFDQWNLLTLIYHSFITNNNNYQLIPSFISDILESQKLK